MAKDKPFENAPEDEFIAKLFGDVAGLGDEELDLLFEALAPGVDAGEAARAVVERVAARYRKENKTPPKHVLVCLKGAKPESLEDAKPSKLKEMVDALSSPFTAPATDVAIAYRNLKDKSEKDQKAMDELADELAEDWEKEEE